jgi:hypothetical protein
MEKKEIKKPTTKEIQLWTATQNVLIEMVGYCARYPEKGLQEETKVKLADQRSKYHQKAHSLSDDMEENNRIIAKYSPWIREDKVTLEFLLNDDI